jgi:hypothetical protein
VHEMIISTTFSSAGCPLSLQSLNFGSKGEKLGIQSRPAISIKQKVFPSAFVVQKSGLWPGNRGSYLDVNINPMLFDCASVT